MFSYNFRPVWTLNGTALACNPWSSVKAFCPRPAALAQTSPSLGSLLPPRRGGRAPAGLQVGLHRAFRELTESPLSAHLAYDKGPLIPLSSYSADGGRQRASTPRRPGVASVCSPASVCRSRA